MLFPRLACIVLIAIMALSPAIGKPSMEPQGLENALAIQAVAERPIQPTADQELGRVEVGKSKSRAQAKKDAKSSKKKAKKTRKAKKQKQDRKARSAGADTSIGPVRADAIDEEFDCGPGLVPIPGTGLCTHGPDPAPPGTARDLIIDTPSDEEVRVETAGIACLGDGQSGNRVQVIYAYDVARGNQLHQVIGNIRITAASADELMRQSSVAAGQEMHFVFVHDSQCNIDVQAVGFNSATMNNFAYMINTMFSGAQNRQDRIYLIFADTTSAGICGIGTMVPDDSASPTNKNNIGPSYARVDRNCWAPQTVLHELIHNLGGVQNSAPNSSGGSHCIDEWDVMCYSDHPRYPAMRYICQDKATYQNRLDCNLDDYFNPNPAPGSYLDTHWNTADNVFLLKGPAHCPATAQGCVGSVSLSASHSTIKKKKRLRLTASVSNAAAHYATIEIRMCKGSTCTWESGRPVATLSGSDPTFRWKANGKGKVTFVARMTTSGGAVTSNPVTVNIKQPKKKR